MISKPHQFVFIGGLHRSGTSIIFRALREHPSVSGFTNTEAPEDEGQHLQTIYPTPRQKIMRFSRDPQSPVFKALRKLYLRRTILFGFYQSEHLTESSTLVSILNQKLLFLEWSRYWDLDKLVLLEKSPPNLLKTRFLQALFPGAFFIIITRHPIATALAAQKFARWNIASTFTLFDHWITSHGIFAADRPYLEHVLVITYEDFTHSTESALKRIYSFLELESYPCTLDIRQDTNQKYLSQWRKWRSQMLTRRYADFLIDRFETRVNQMGYSLSDLPPV